LLERLRQIAFGLVCGCEIVAGATIARGQLDRGLKFFDGAIVMLQLDFEPAQRDPWSGARSMVLLGAIEVLARFIVIKDASVSLGNSQLGGFVARIELQHFIECSDRAGKILCAAQRFTKFHAQANISRLYFYGAAEFIRTGKLRALGVTTAERSEVFPDIPAIGEFVPGYVANLWNGIGAPRATPPEIIDKLNAAINAGLNDPKVKAQFAELGSMTAPLTPADFRLIPGVLESLGVLRDSGFLLFLVSNQPNYAKGKVTLDALEHIHDRLESALDEADIAFNGFHYCLHHPQAVVPSLQGPCQCRKPSPYFLLKAQNEHAIDLSKSWMIGDRATDVQCGKAAGVRTIRIVDAGAEADEAGDSAADFTARNLASAVRILLANNS